MAETGDLTVTNDELELTKANLGLMDNSFYNTGVITAIDQNVLPDVGDGVIRTGLTFTSSNTYQKYALGVEYAPQSDGSLDINIHELQGVYNPDEVPIDANRIDAEIENWKDYRQENPVNTPVEALGEGYVNIDANLSPIEKAMSEAGVLPHGYSDFFKNDIIAKDDFFSVEKDGGTTSLTSITLVPGANGEAARQAIGITNTFNESAGIVSSHVSIYALDGNDNLVIAQSPENIRSEPFGRAADKVESTQHDPGLRQRYYEPN